MEYFCWTKGWRKFFSSSIHNPLFLPKGIYVSWRGSNNSFYSYFFLSFITKHHTMNIIFFQCTLYILYFFIGEMWKGFFKSYAEWTRTKGIIPSGANNSKSIQVSSMSRWKLTIRSSEIILAVFMNFLKKPNCLHNGLIDSRK